MVLAKAWEKTSLSRERRSFLYHSDESELVSGSVIVHLETENIHPNLLFTWGERSDVNDCAMLKQLLFPNY